nr:unnamed protein product [Callosobruchus chinensis]
MNEGLLADKIHCIAKQFLCNVPVSSIKWEDIFDSLSYEGQQTLLNATVNSELVQKHPINLNYQKHFLKEIINRLEREGTDIHDDLYSAYGRTMALKVSTDSFFKHYSVGGGGRTISLKESGFLISNGTTGLRTWEAALALSEWIVSNKDLLENKKVLELGSGLGLTGLVLSIECAPNTVYLTDCHPSVLKNMYDNVRLNIERENADSTDETDGTVKLTDRCIYHSSGRKPEIAIFNLPWEDVVEETCKQIGEIDMIIAADIVYDEDLFADLLEAMRNFSRYCDVKDFIFACTERNPGTLDKFIKDAGKK